jgi:hypothetical protein
VVNQHFSSFNNPEQHFEQEAFGSDSLSLFNLAIQSLFTFVISSTHSLSSDVDLLWSKDESDIYFKLFDF